MDVQIFRVLARAQGEYSMPRRDARVAETIHLGALLLADFDPDQRRLYIESHLCDEGEWIAFYLRGVTQLELFRDLLDPAVVALETEDAGDLARRKLDALRSLVGQLTLRPADFWAILETAGLHDEELTMLALMAGRRSVTFRRGTDRGPKGQLVLDLDGLLGIFTRAEPVGVLLRVDGVNRKFAAVSPMDFSELPLVPIGKKLKLVWPSQNASWIAHRLLDANLGLRPVRVIACPAATQRGTLVALELVRLDLDVAQSRRSSSRLHTSDWMHGAWPLPGPATRGTEGVIETAAKFPDLPF